MNERSHPFVLELGTEEIPAAALPGTVAQIKEAAELLLEEHRLAYTGLEALGTPRRLVLVISALAARQTPASRVIMGPPHRLAFDAAGRPAAAALGFARAQGLSAAAAETHLGVLGARGTAPRRRAVTFEIRTTEKGAYLFAVREERGEHTMRLLPHLLSLLIGQLSFQKTMRWNEGGARFIRPVRWILALYGTGVVPVSFGGVRSGRTTGGPPHRRFSPMNIPRASAYLPTLERAGILVAQDRRKKQIRDHLVREAKRLEASIPEDDALLERVAWEVESPTTFSGHFDRAFLRLPHEVVTTVLQEQQGYVPLKDRHGHLLPCFLGVLNIHSRRTASIRAAHERVLKARLDDAQFYYEQDLRRPLADRVHDLRGVVFHERLGTLYDKVVRVAAAAKALASHLGAHDPALIERAAWLSKADVLTGMVAEFPNLQGVMGREYARVHGEPREVAEAIYEHTLPRASGDALPRHEAGRILGIADRLDTLVGCFAAGIVPTGSEDPYGLRRVGQGVLLLLLDGRYVVSLRHLIQRVLEQLQPHMSGDPVKIEEDVLEFLRERMVSWCLAGGHRAALLDALLAPPRSFEDPYDASLRIAALSDFSQRPLFRPLMVAHRRAWNILSEGLRALPPVGPPALHEPASQQLWEAAERARQHVEQACQARRYLDALDALAALRDPLDTFYREVFVMTGGPEQEHRLALLAGIAQTFSLYGDFSQIPPEMFG